MKKLLPILVLMVLALSFFSCDKDGDGCYDFDSQTELSVDGNLVEAESSGD